MNIHILVLVIAIILFGLLAFKTDECFDPRSSCNFLCDHLLRHADS